MTKIKFDHQCIKCDNFKSKQSDIIRSTIAGSRLNDDMKFKSYANISFDEQDKKHVEPIVNELEMFHRTKTNCLVYDIFSKNSDFDTLYIYQTLFRRGGFFGFVLKNESTGKQWHKYFVDYAEDELVRQIWKVLWLMTDNARKIYGEYI